MTALFRVELHMDRSGLEVRDISWWADSLDLEDWSATAQTLASLKELVKEGIEYFTGSTDFSILYSMDETPQPSQGGPEAFETINQEPQGNPPSRGLQASTLVSA